MNETAAKETQATEDWAQIKKLEKEISEKTKYIEKVQLLVDEQELLLKDKEK